MARETPMDLHTNDPQGKGLSPYHAPFQGGTSSLPLHNPFAVLVDRASTDFEELAASPIDGDAVNGQTSDVEEFVPLSP